MRTSVSPNKLFHLGRTTLEGWEGTKRFNWSGTRTVLAVCALVILTASLPLTELLIPAQLSAPLSGGWHITSHISTNSYFPLHESPYIEVLGQVQSFVVFLLAIGAGVTLLPGSSVLIGIVAALLVALWAGNDVLLLRGILGTVLTAACAARAGSWKGVGGWLIVIAAALVTTLLAQSTALLCIPLGLGIAFVTHTPSRPISLSTTALFLLPALLFLFSVPQLPIPDYPPTSHVVPLSGLPWFSRPRLGFNTPIPFLNREAQKSLGGHVLLGLFAVALIFLYPLRSKVRSPSLLAFVLVLLSACYWDLRASEIWVDIGPFASSARILPHLFGLPISWIALLVSMILVVYQVGSTTGAFTCLLCAISLVVGPILLRRQVPFLQTHDRAVALSEFLPPRALSPSLYPLRAYGMAAFKRAGMLNNASFTSLRRDSVTVSASHNRDPKTLNGLLDRRANERRWSAQHGGQSGDEWIEIYLLKPTPLEGIELDVGPYLSDFPRGIRITHSPECTTAPEQRRILIDYPSWQGPLRLTSDGYPYFGAQSEVQIVFPETITGGCLRIEQTGIEKVFDWSVTEIRRLSIRADQPEENTP